MAINPETLTLSLAEAEELIYIVRSYPAQARLRSTACALERKGLVRLDGEGRWLPSAIGILATDELRAGLTSKGEPHR